MSVGWPTGVATRGTSRSSSGGVLRDSRLQSLLEAWQKVELVRGKEPSMGLLGGLQDRAGRERGLGQVQCSKAEQHDGFRACFEREPSLGQVQDSKGDRGINLMDFEAAIGKDRGP